MKEDSKEKKLRRHKTPPRRPSGRSAAGLERKAEGVEKASQAMLQAIMDNSMAVIYMKDRDGRFVLINRWYEERFNVRGEDVIGRTDYDLFPKEIADRLRENDKKALEAGSPVQFEEEVREPDGLMHCYISIKFPIPGMRGAICGISTDITERKRMEEELFKARKLESLGVLAGGIAHDFNNLLLGILGNVSVAKTLIKPDDRVFEMLDQIEKAAARAKSLTRQILTFSRGGEPIREAASIGDLLKNSAAMVLKGSNVRCEFGLPEGLWHADVDEGQVGQVFNNILLNAMQSMPDGGVISIEAGNFAVADNSLPVKKGDYVRVAIKDEGRGIPEKIIGKIFDPFFTTRQKASGLGLALSYSIVRKHGGYICAESKPNKGAVFYVYLPAAPKEACAERTDEPERPFTGKARILVMDDEELVRDVLDSMLGNLGYEVSFALNGAEAIGLFRKAKESGKPFDAVILDLTVPGGMGGRETMQRLLEIDPRVKGIVSSGYSKDPIMSDFKKYGFRAVMAKPFRVSEFGRVIKNVLAEEA